ncbi:Sec-independent protein translocase subunit TatA [Ornithinimicrobium murale]|uniref:Sec-independent protein translocase subunit TatA n=1 Tax=Ornithinimicrobium murale TaxID=1050153 RepID=UPI000E0E0369|nr:Sec-independent protein translocase subunit TatA [Ornithinimicrobium murale]
MRPQPWHIVVLVIALVLLFGWKHLPNMARSLGQSMRIFKSEVDQMKEPSAASKDTVRGEQAERDTSTNGDPKATGLGDRARDTAEGVKDKGASVRDEFRDGLAGEDSADATHRDDPRA